MYETIYSYAKSSIFSSNWYPRVLESEGWMMKNHYHLQIHLWRCISYRISEGNRMYCLWFWCNTRYLSCYVTETKSIPRITTRNLENWRWSRVHARWVAMNSSFYRDWGSRWIYSEKICRTSRIWLYWVTLWYCWPDISERTWNSM